MKLFFNNTSIQTAAWHQSFVTAEIENLSIDAAIGYWVCSLRER